MNILFLTLVNIKDFEEKQNIYSDLCRELVSRGHNVHIVCPDEAGEATSLLKYREGSGILKVRTGRVQKTSFIKKGIATLMLGSQFKRAIKKHLCNVKFDLVIYSTPPITLYSIVKYVKKRDKATTYLLLKDIFPQNALDIGIMSKRGIKAPIYLYFRLMEKRLYAISDRIGCMSEANAEYIKRQDPEIPKEKIHISPNSVEPIITTLSLDEKNAIRVRYGLPTDKKIFIYGGNIGKPQGVPFIIDCLNAVGDIDGCHFVICGTGTELPLLKKYSESTESRNFTLIPGLPRAEYEEFVGCCDVGLIFLDYRFTIPNFPSRLLSYMQKSMPVISCTDRATDIGRTIEEGGFGVSCFSNNAHSFRDAVLSLISEDTDSIGRNGAKYLLENFKVQKSADIILEKYNEVDR
ncbi:MAG: glycosyltransferase family 4 protein [Ruminococcaceae bacterium]|nr:glycosyltransferase family 4 protein [Oscillospiraceae bacterium]